MSSLCYCFSRAVTQVRGEVELSPLHLERIHSLAGPSAYSRRIPKGSPNTTKHRATLNWTKFWIAPGFEIGFIRAVFPQSKISFVQIPRKNCASYAGTHSQQIDFGSIKYYSTSRPPRAKSLPSDFVLQHASLEACIPNLVV